MIVKLHGTSGSGKTTVARGLMEKAIGPIRTIKNTRGRPEAYMFNLPEIIEPLFILGSYESTCGGMDTVDDTDDQLRLIEQSAKYGHVFYEGLLGSEFYGRIGKLSEHYGDKHIFAFLDTPIEVCIARVKKRRLERGVTKPLNEANTRGRVAKINRLQYKLIHELHRPVVVIDHTRAVEQVYNLFKGINGSGHS